jgi:hypothetical protein
MSREGARQVKREDAEPILVLKSIDRERAVV